MNLTDNNGKPKYTDLMRDEISTKSVVRGVAGEVSNNVQSFTFNVGAHQRWQPELSSWVLRIAVTDAAGAQLATAADIAPALNCALNGWQYVQFYAGNQKIDEVSEHVAETASIRTRLEKSKAWFDSIGKTQYWDSSFKLRQNTIVSDAPDGATAVSEFETINADFYNVFPVAANNQIAIANLGGVQSTITFTQNGAAAIPDLTATTNLAVGDKITVVRGQAAPTIVTVQSIAAAVITVTPQITVLGAANVAAGDIINHNRLQATGTTLSSLNVLPVYNGRDELEIQFKLPLGISYVNEMPPGEYEFRLRGFSYGEFAKRFIESLNGDQDVGVNFRLNVVDLYYYAYLVETPERIESAEKVISFKCYEAQKKKILSTNNQLQFTVKGNSSALGFALQDGRIGSSTLYSPAKMKAFNDAGIVGGGPLGQAGRIDTKISYYQIRYANKYKPEPAQQDDLAARKTRIVQSYLETYKNSGAYFYEGAMETLDDYLERGPIYFWQWPRDKQTYATEARVDLRLSADPQSNVFCVFFFQFNRTVRLKLQNGRVTGVIRDV